MNKDKQTAPTGPIYAPAPMDLGFVVMIHDGDPSKITSTLKSIERHYPGAKSVVTIPTGVKNPYKGAIIGKTSITSMINVGMKNAPAEWNVMVFAGVRIKEKLDRRYSTFMESRYDIFYPLIWGSTNFINAPLNGLTIHRDTFKEIPKLADNNPLEMCKMIWFLDAIGAGCKFKAIAGTRMC